MGSSKIQRAFLMWQNEHCYARGPAFAMRLSPGFGGKSAHGFLGRSAPQHEHEQPCEKRGREKKDTGYRPVLL